MNLQFCAAKAAKEILIFWKVFIAFCAGKFIVRPSINLKDDQFS